MKMTFWKVSIIVGKGGVLGIMRRKVSGILENALSAIFQIEIEIDLNW